MKRARNFTTSKFTALRPISRRQVHSFMLEKLENIQNGDKKKRIKLSKTLTAEVANLATSYTEKVLAISCAIARKRHYDGGTILLDGTEITISDVEKASAYVLTPYLLQRLRSKRKAVNKFLYETTTNTQYIGDASNEYKFINEYLLVDDDGPDMHL